MHTNSENPSAAGRRCLSARSTEYAVLHPDVGVTLATILMVCFIAEHNLPFNIADHFVELCKRMFPDSAIAQNMCMKKTKCTEVIKNLGRCVTTEFVEKLRKYKFSVIIDESTDVSNTKCLTLIVRYFDVDDNKIKLATLGLIDMYNNARECAGSSGQNL